MEKKLIHEAPPTSLDVPDVNIAPAAWEPIKLHPSNNRYFLFRGAPTILITSAEHYGAVLNLDFDYIVYLNELQAKGLNKTRIFSGEYIEKAADIPSIGVNNMLVPASGRFIAPWARSSTPGYSQGGNKFDLDTWDTAYFDRLTDYVYQAGLRGIVVEVSLFCSKYKNNQWDDSPMKSTNNINGVGDVAASEALTTGNGNLLAHQHRLVHKYVTVLKDFDNVYYEVVNEPYMDYGATDEFQDHFISTIVHTEASFPHKHLIALNVANFWMTVTNPNSHVSIFNFHYAHPPDAVAMNYGLNKVIAYDESGFEGIEDQTYRREGWDFIIAGGAVFDHLDFSFIPSHEDGTFVIPSDTPGGGGPAFRGQMSILKNFIYDFDFLRMAPDNSVITGEVPDGTTVRALLEAGKQYAIYVNGSSLANLIVSLPPAEYTAMWVDTKTGSIVETEQFSHSGGNHTFVLPAYTDDIALSIKSA